MSEKYVVPAPAGIQIYGHTETKMDTGLRRYDGRRSPTPFQATFCVTLLLILTLLSAANARPLTIAYPSTTWNTSLPLSMAREFNMFASEGLEICASYIRGGPVVIAALISGDVDMAIMAGTTAVTSISRGADLVVVGGHTAQIDQVLMGAKGVSKLADLKGKVIGVTGSGGVTEFATVEALARNSLVRDKDYKILYAGTSPTRVRALETGVVQAAPFSATETVLMERQGFPVIMEIGKALPEFPFVVVVAHRLKLKAKSAEITALLQERAQILDEFDPKRPRKSRRRGGKKRTRQRHLRPAQVPQLHRRTPTRSCSPRKTSTRCSTPPRSPRAPTRRRGRRSPSPTSLS